MTEGIYKSYHHAPAHLFRAGSSYIVTAGTYGKVSHLHNDERKQQWRKSLDFVVRREKWSVVAWVVLDNHYHILLQAPEGGAERLPQMLGDMHKYLGRRWNGADGTPGRRVWWNYWDTCLTREASYLARLNYIHWNPVKHGLVAQPEDYAFSSYRGFLEEQNGELVHRWEGDYPWDRVSIRDDF